jgi:hypothetical protein
MTFSRPAFLPQNDVFHFTFFIACGNLLICFTSNTFSTRFSRLVFRFNPLFRCLGKLEIEFLVVMIAREEGRGGGGGCSCGKFQIIQFLNEGVFLAKFWETLQG